MASYIYANAFTVTDNPATRDQDMNGNAIIGAAGVEAFSVAAVELAGDSIQLGPDNKVTLSALGINTPQNYNFPSDPGASGQFLALTGGSGQLTWVTGDPAAGVESLNTLIGAVGITSNTVLIDACGNNITIELNAEYATLQQLGAVEIMVSNVETVAYAAQSTANQALTNAGNAQTTADQAILDASNAQTTANTAQSTADIAIGDSATAFTTANQAILDASGALDVANQAILDASGAQATADSAAEEANTAKGIANQAILDASNAQTTANQAILDASGALDVANQAILDASGAKTTADQAIIDASNAQTTANQAILDASAAQTTANEAILRLPIGDYATGTTPITLTGSFQNVIALMLVTDISYTPIMVWGNLNVLDGDGSESVVEVRIAVYGTTTQYSTVIINTVANGHHETIPCIFSGLGPLEPGNCSISLEARVTSGGATTATAQLMAIGNSRTV